MPRFRFSSTPDSQIDPFNAGDPVMPGDEPEWLDEEPADEDAGLGGNEDARGHEEPDYAPHGEQGGEPHKRDDNYQAPTTRRRDYDAPSTEDAPAHGGARPAAAGRRGGRGCMVLIVSAVLVVVALGGAFADWVATEGPSLSDDIDALLDDDGITFDDYVSDGDADWRDTADELDRAAGEAVEQRLDGLLADPAAGPLHDRAAAYLDEELQSWEGYTAAELGIDADAWATWALTGATYELSSVYAYDDGTGSAYFDTEARNLQPLRHHQRGGRGALRLPRRARPLRPGRRDAGPAERGAARRGRRALAGRLRAVRIPGGRVRRRRARAYGRDLDRRRGVARRGPRECPRPLLRRPLPSRSRARRTP